MCHVHEVLKAQSDWLSRVYQHICVCVLVCMCTKGGAGVQDTGVELMIKTAVFLLALPTDHAGQCAQNPSKLQDSQESSLILSLVTEE